MNDVDDHFSSENTLWSVKGQTLA